MSCDVNAQSTPDELPERIGVGQKSWYQKYQSQKNSPDPEQQLLNTDAEPALDEGFESLFNGKDLMGWRPLGGRCTFEVVDEAIVGTCIRKSPSTYLCTEADDYGDFIFSCDIKWDVEGNTGVMFRAHSKANGKAKKDNDKTKIVYGPQVEMEEPSKGRFWSGGIYGQSCGGYYYPMWLKEHEPTRTAIKKDDWNRVTIHAQGKVVKTWINGVAMAHWVDEQNEFPTGRFGLQVHAGKQGTIRFKNMRVKRLGVTDKPADGSGKKAAGSDKKQGDGSAKKVAGSDKKAVDGSAKKAVGSDKKAGTP